MYWETMGHLKVFVFFCFVGEGHPRRSDLLWHRPLQQLAWRPLNSLKRIQILLPEIVTIIPLLSPEKSWSISSNERAMCHSLYQPIKDWLQTDLFTTDLNECWNFQLRGVRGKERQASSNPAFKKRGFGFSFQGIRYFCAITINLK